MPKINRFIIITVLFLIIVLVVVFLVQRGGVKPPPTVPTPTPEQLQTFTYKDLLPGTSTQKDVAVKLGSPIRREQEATGTMTLVYPSGIGSLATRVQIDTSGVVKLIREPVDITIHLNDQTVQLGTADLILYGDYSLKGYQLLVYVRRGIAFLANPTTQQVKERWYFAPTTQQSFMTVLAPGFQASPPPPQE